MLQYWHGIFRAQIVGWPPVRSHRKNILSSQKTSSKNGDEESEKISSTLGAALVKVSLDGAPYLRKVDLSIYKSYRELSDALGNMFNSFTIGNNYNSYVQLIISTFLNFDIRLPEPSCSNKFY